MLLALPHRMVAQRRVAYSASLFDCSWMPHMFMAHRLEVRLRSDGAKSYLILSERCGAFHCLASWSAKSRAE